MDSYILSNGVKIPKLGFGTYLILDGGESMISSAAHAGYRLFDTASFYKNEGVVGRGLKESGVPREELFITSKVWKTDMGYDETKRSFFESCEKLGTDYLDLFLIHYPRPLIEDNNRWKRVDAETWRAMEELYKDGRIRAIGVSNFLPHHLMNLLENCTVAPMVDQLEFHPGHTQWAAVEYCREHDILVEAWRPFGKGRVLKDERVTSLAAKYGTSPAQLCLKYALQEGILPLAKSSDEARMRENLSLDGFEISREDIYYIRCLPQFGWSGEHPDFVRDMTAANR